MKVVGVAYALMVALVTVTAAKPAEAAAITCLDVEVRTIPCIPFLRGVDGAASPSEYCCYGMHSLRRMLGAAADRRTACSCMKKGASRFGLMESAGAALPTLCDVSLPFPISLSSDCSRIQ